VRQGHCHPSGRSAPWRGNVSTTVCPGPPPGAMRAAMLPTHGRAGRPEFRSRGTQECGVPSAVRIPVPPAGAPTRRSPRRRTKRAKSINPHDRRRAESREAICSTPCSLVETISAVPGPVSTSETVSGPVRVLDRLVARLEALTKRKARPGGRIQNRADGKTGLPYTRRNRALKQKRHDGDSGALPQPEPSGPGPAAIDNQVASDPPRSSRHIDGAADHWLDAACYTVSHPPAGAIPAALSARQLKLFRQLPGYQEFADRAARTARGTGSPAANPSGLSRTSLDSGTCNW
jgi:hypothetical protein